jgi:hypothetical protein
MQRAARHPRRASAPRRQRAAPSSTPRPSLSTATAPGLRVQPAARQPRRTSARGSGGPLRPARRARASARQPRKAGEYNVLHVNLGANQLSADGEPLRPARRTGALTQRLHRAVEDNVLHGNLTNHRHSVGREPLQPNRRADASARRLHRAGEDNVRHVNLDALLHSVGREPPRPASRVQASRKGRAGPAITTSGTSTSTHVSTRYAANPFDQPAAPKLRTCEGTGLARIACRTSTSTQPCSALAGSPEASSAYPTRGSPSPRMASRTSITPVQ